MGCGGASEDFGNETRERGPEGDLREKLKIGSDMLSTEELTWIIQEFDDWERNQES